MQRERQTLKTVTLEILVGTYLYVVVIVLVIIEYEVFIRETGTVQRVFFFFSPTRLINRQGDHHHHLRRRRPVPNILHIEVLTFIERCLP